MLRRRTMGNKKLVLFQKRFYPAGNYTWTVPPGCTEVDVFLVGAGGGAPISKVGESTSYPGSSDYTEGTGLYSYDNTSEWRSGAGGGGYGGGAGSNIYINDKTQSLKGGDGTVLIRYYAYEE